MKKQLFTLVLTLSALCGYAADTTAKYCEVTVWQPWFKRYNAEVNYSGTNTGKFKRVNATTGKAIRFESKLDAMTYFQKEGWELVSTYHVRGNETHFFMKKSS